MKLKILFIAIITLLIGSNLGLQADSSQTMKFVTSGNCYLCKLRIENAVKELTGIEAILWDYEKKCTTVSFDASKTDIYAIMKKIASVGHDTEWYEGDNDKYFALIGTCCEYPRTIDYSKAKIGYLSLMDQWVSVNSESNGKINLYSANSGNSLKYTVTGYNNTTIALQIYSLAGVAVYSNSNISLSGEIDLSSVSSGAYIVVMTNENKRIFQQKIIK